MILPGQVIGQPCLPTFRFAANPIAKNISLVGISLSLDRLKIHKVAAVTANCWWVGIDGLSPQVKLWYFRKLRKIQSSSNCSAFRSAYRSYIVMHFGIQILRQPIAQKRQPIGVVESTEARPRIFARVLDRNGYILEAPEAMPERAQRNRFVSLAAPDICARESKFKIARGLKLEFLHVHPGVVRVGMPFQTADDKFIAHGANKVREQWDMQRLYAVDAERIVILRVVAPVKRATKRRPIPDVAFADRNLMVQ